MNKLSKYQREYLKQLIIECEVQRFTRPEAHEYIKAKMNLPTLSIEVIDFQKRRLKQYTEKRLDHLRRHKTAYIDQFFKRIDEIEKYMQTLWTTINSNLDDPMLTKACVSELHQLTITLSNLYEMLPVYCGSLTYANTEEQDNATASPSEDEGIKVEAASSTNRKF
jgi:hypothetical protein